MNYRVIVPKYSHANSSASRNVFESSDMGEARKEARKKWKSGTYRWVYVKDDVYDRVWYYNGETFSGWTLDEVNRWKRTANKEGAQ